MDFEQHLVASLLYPRWNVTGSSELLQSRAYCPVGQSVEIVVAYYLLYRDDVDELGGWDEKQEEEGCDEADRVGAPQLAGGDAVVLPVVQRQGRAAEAGEPRDEHTYLVGNRNIVDCAEWLLCGAEDQPELRGKVCLQELLLLVVHQDRQRCAPDN